MIRFEENVPLKDVVAYRIGGAARYFFSAATAEDVQEAVHEAAGRKLPVFILGAGTNLLVGDEGFPGLVIKISIRTLSAEGGLVRAGAGVEMRELLEFAAAKGLSGLEWAGGLPGTVGGAVYGNAGAFGGEMKDSIARVESFDVATRTTVQRSSGECHFGYRSSAFKERRGKEIVLEAAFRLSPGDPAAIARAIAEKVSYRRERHPLEYPNIGSIFKNVPVEQAPEAVRAAAQAVIKQDPFLVIPAAYLISEAGLKGERAGGAEVSPKHPNFIVNRGGAAAADVKALIAKVKRTVKSKFGVELEEEAQLI
ncbi:MAG: UDP-N-acetylmuramate dehydrogenase [Patescibacteria group bacterium]|nr:UDP-N-acetylmuramate dehydrogenase [Patescibacteria group bacterium]